MNLASTFRHLPAALLAATLAFACGPKDGGGDTDTAADSSGGSSGSTTVAEQCTPGDTKSGEGDCSSCVCSDFGTWQCGRCSPTTGVLETSTGGSTTDPTSTTGPATTGETTTGATTGTDTGETADTTTGDGFLPTCSELAPSDDLDIVAAQVVGDELVVEVGYGGGCEPHDFTLCFDSIAPDTEVTNLAIDHDAHGDACEAYLMEMRKFDLTPLQQAGPSPFEFVLLGLEGASFTYVF
ncbi:MAG: hypothetical protein H0T76_24460 [Nannocystis sp.]|nr:hypothetical protein [Nannocystis sp.]MBA3549643.1 hypothetical protein [Nannocystis sp.]